MRVWPALLRLLLFCLSCSALSGLGVPGRARAAEAAQAETRVRASDLAPRARIGAGRLSESQERLRQVALGNPNASGSLVVYNLEVEDWHTYVVGKLGAWVHNTCNPAQTAKAIAEHFVNANRGSVTKSLPDISKMKLGQDKAIEVLQEMYQASGRGTAGAQTLADGSKALLSRRLGPDQPILVIAKDGAVRAAKATIELTGGLKSPLGATDIVFGGGEL